MYIFYVCSYVKCMHMGKYRTIIAFETNTFCRTRTLIIDINRYKKSLRDLFFIAILVVLLEQQK